MIGVLAVAVGLQTGGWTAAPPAPTVGDTVVLTRRVPVAAGARGRAGPLERTDVLEPLADPAVAWQEGRLVVRYPIALFAAGIHRIPMPALELVYPDGGVETVVGDTAIVGVGSVLPADSMPAPRASRAPVPRSRRRPVPVLLLVTGVVTGIGGWVMWRRRRGPRPAWPHAPPEPPDVPVMRWLTAGEGRAAATWAMERLRARIAQSVPDAERALSTEECVAVLGRERPRWPLRAIGELLGELDRARFAPLAPADAGELVDRAELMIEQLETGEPERPNEGADPEGAE